MTGWRRATCIASRSTAWRTWVAQGRGRARGTARRQSGDLGRRLAPATWPSPRRRIWSRRPISSCDCADSLAATYVLSDACHAQRKPLVSASVLGTLRLRGAFCGGAPSYRAVFPDMPAVVGSCAANGVLGSAVAVLGGLQAHMALQILLDMTPSPLGRLVSVDLRTLSFGGFAFHDAAEPDGPAIPFVTCNSLVNDDLVVELRGVHEAPMPVTADALRLGQDELDRVPTRQAGGVLLRQRHPCAPRGAPAGGAWSTRRRRVGAKPGLTRAGGRRPRRTWRPRSRPAAPARSDPACH